MLHFNEFRDMSPSNNSLVNATALRVLSNPQVAGSVKTIMAEGDETTSKILVIALEAHIATSMIAKGETREAASEAAAYVADRVLRSWHARRGILAP